MSASTEKYLYWIASSITHRPFKQSNKYVHYWTARTNLSQLNLFQYNSRWWVWIAVYLQLPLSHTYWLKRKIQLMFHFHNQVGGTMPRSVSKRIISLNVSFGFSINDGSAVVGHGFVRRSSIRSTVKNNFPHVWTVGIGHRVLEKIFPTLCLGLVDCLVNFMTSVYPLLAILMDCLMEAISNTDFGLDMWSHPRFWSLAGFRFSDVSSYCRDEDGIEVRNLKR